MTNYYAVCVANEGMVTLRKPDSTYYKPFFRSAAVCKVTITDIYNYFKKATQMQIFSSEEEAIAYAKEKSGFIDSKGTFISHPVMLVSHSIPSISEPILVDIAPQDNLWSAKILHAGDQYIKTPAAMQHYKDYPFYVQPHEFTFNNSLFGDFDSRIASVLLAASWYLTGEINKATINSEMMSSQLIVTTAALLLYVKFCSNRVRTNNNKEIAAEIASQTTQNRPRP